MAVGKCGAKWLERWQSGGDEGVFDGVEGKEKVALCPCSIEGDDKGKLSVRTSVLEDTTKSDRDVPLSRSGVSTLTPKLFA